MSDLIDRQALLKQIDIDSDGEPGYYGDTWKFIDTIKNMPNVHDLPKDTDTISRQAAIDALEKIPVREFKKTDDGLLDALISIGQVYRALKQLPPVQPEPQWIPVTKRLPEEDGEYLVLCHTRSKYKPYVYDILSFANDLYQIDEYDFIDKKGQSEWFYRDREYGFCEDNDVYAWMPLPEPWEEGENE